MDPPCVYSDVTFIKRLLNVGASLYVMQGVATGHIAYRSCFQSAIILPKLTFDCFVNIIDLNFHVPAKQCNCSRSLAF